MDRTQSSGVGVLALRIGLYLAVAGVLGAVGVATAGYLGAVAVVGGVALLVGGGGETLLVPGLALVGVIGAGASAVGVMDAARRADRALVAAATPPSPVERARREYVRDEIGEREFERRVERALAAERRRERERGRERRRR